MIPAAGPHSWRYLLWQWGNYTLPILASEVGVSLSGRLLRQVLLVAGGAFLLFAVLFLGLYREQLASERAASAEQLNRLLRVALENAMLKRDVPGLRDIVSQLGRQPGIAGVMILAPGGEVRFASRPEQLGQALPQLTAGLIPGETRSQFISEPGQPEVLRSLNPVPNQAPCTGCHGPLAQHTINGVLVVDFHADTLRQQAWRSAALFAAAGLAVLGLTLASLWWSLRRRVIDPLARLDRAARGLAAGDGAMASALPALLAPTAAAAEADEISRLAGSFQHMAGQLAAQLQRSRDQQAFLQDLLDGLPDGLRVIRVADSRIIAVNAAYCRQLGQSPETAVGQPCHRSSHGRAEPCAATLVVCPLRELQQPGQSLQCRHHHRHADGREVPVEVHAVLLERRGEAGPERLLVETTTDLSQRVRHSQEQRLSELGLLAAGIAHEIHNPLGSMRLAVEGLLRNLRQGQAQTQDGPQRLASYLEMMNAEIDRCTRITQRLLLLSRLPEQQP
ncbi:MAG: hypothetical protein RIR00_2698, partial [Pseudomonadota bacterium]